MDKTERLVLIIAACRITGRPANRIKNVTPVAFGLTSDDIKQETDLAALHNDDNSVLDVDANVTLISPRMAALEEEPRKLEYHHPGEECLTAHERKRAAREVNEYRCRARPTYDRAFWLWAPPARDRELAIG